jgi:sugar lactone lactonase YvrE
VSGPGRVSGIVATATGDVWVATDQPGAGQPTLLQHIDAAGRRAGSVLIGDAQAGITALAIDGAGRLLAASRTPAAVFAVDPATGASSKLATIPDVTPCVPALVTAGCDGGLVDAAPVLSALAVDRAGALFAADSGQGAIWRVAPGGQVTQWTVDSTWVNPTRPSGPAGLAFDGAGNLVVVVTSTLSDDDGVVYLQQVQPDGTAGTRTELARTGAGSRPAGLVLGSSGRLYITLSETGRVVVLDPRGRPVGTSPAPNTAALTAPWGLTFRGRSLLVACGAPGGAAGGLVVRLPVGEPVGEPVGAPR